MSKEKEVNLKETFFFVFLMGMFTASLIIQVQKPYDVLTLLIIGSSLLFCLWSFIKDYRKIRKLKMERQFYTDMLNGVRKLNKTL